MLVAQDHTHDTIQTTPTTPTSNKSKESNATTERLLSVESTRLLSVVSQYTTRIYPTHGWGLEYTPPMVGMGGRGVVVVGDWLWLRVCGGVLSGTHPRSIAIRSGNHSLALHIGAGYEEVEVHVVLLRALGRPDRNH